MSLPRSFRAAPAAPLSPAEKLLVAQTLALLVVSSWAGGGMARDALPWILALTALSLPLWLVRRAEGVSLGLRALAPAILWLALVGVACLNPSHELRPDGTWHERAGWWRWLPTTVDPARALTGALPWLAALVQGAALSGLRPPARAVRLIWAGAALNGFTLAAVGAGFHFFGANQMLGAFDVPEPTYFFATFYYKNHWAAYGALGSIAGAALALAHWPAALTGEPVARGRVVFFGGTALVTLCTLPLPGSRAGLLLAAAITGGFAIRAAVPLARNRAGGGRAWGAVVLVAIGLLIAGFVARFYLERGRVDFARTERQIAQHTAGGMLDLRVEISRDTWRMFEARPWFGWGVGCYEVVFPVFQGAYLRDEGGQRVARVEFAHNDWFQILAETGVAGAALLLGAAGARCWLSWRAAGGSGRTALAGTGLLLLYAWIDFPFHNPAVLLLWTTLVTTAGGLRRG